VLLSGGVDPHGTALRTLIDATLTLDGDRLLGWRGSVLFADFQVQRGDDGSLDTGDLQRYSNIDGEERTQLAKLWFEQAFAGDAVRLRLGKADVNADFDYVEHGYRFLHASFGHSPTMLGMPTYPDPSYGAALLTQPGGGFYANAGVYDGAAQTGVKTGESGPRTLFGTPSDLYGIGEVGRVWGGDGAGLHGRLGLGVWRHTGDFARYDGGSSSGTTGCYAVFAQQLTAATAAADANARGGLGSFLQYGWADPQLSPFEHHVGAGLEWTGPLQQRPDDALGLGVSWARFSQEAGTGLRGDGELAVELFLQLQLTPFCSLQPDLQWIHQPGGVDGVGDALVLTLRTSITF
jgi:porin